MGVNVKIIRNREECKQMAGNAQEIHYSIGKGCPGLFADASLGSFSGS